MENKSVSVIIPAFNEQDSLRETIDKILKVLRNSGSNFELIVVNDGSNDKSKMVLDSINNEKVRVIHHPTNRGYGASLKTGIKNSKHPWILITDADGTYPIDRIPDLISQAGNYDMVIGARVGKKVSDTISRAIGRGIIRRFASYVAGEKITDINSGLRIFRRRDALRFWHLFPDGFSFTTTITVASHTIGNSVKYVAIDYYKRSGKSSIKPIRDFIGFTSLIARLALYFRPLKVFAPIATMLFILAWIVLVGSWLFLPRILDASFAILIIASFQTLFLGLLADMIVKKMYAKDNNHD